MSVDANFNVYDSYEELLYSTIKRKPIRIMPDFPIPTEDVNSTNDLLTLISFIKEHNLHNICSKFKRLVDCEESIMEFNAMVGLDEAKKTMATQILSLCSDNDASSEDSSDVHCVIYGSPGCGKTTLAKVLSKLYLKMGVIKNGTIIKGDRSSMIGEYVGETEGKTKKLLTKALGGVFFLDEAYQLGHSSDGNRDPFAYVCITTIVQFITENKGKFVMILAGYKQDILDNFFAQNEGLDRRFPFKYTLKGYNDDQLLEIFKYQASRAGYKIAGTDNINELNSYDELTNKYPSTINMFANNHIKHVRPAITSSFFRKHKENFQYYGGDTETFFGCCKMIHDKRMFSQLNTDKILSKVDIEKGYKMFDASKSESKTNDNITDRYFI